MLPAQDASGGRKGTVSEWTSIEDSLPVENVWVLAWIYLPKNPLASGPAIAQFTGCKEDEPESYGEYRLTKDAWWANGIVYEKGHVIYWQPLPEPPK